MLAVELELLVRCHWLPLYATRTATSHLRRSTSLHACSTSSSAASMPEMGLWIRRANSSRGWDFDVEQQGSSWWRTQHGTLPGGRTLIRPAWPSTVPVVVPWPWVELLDACWRLGGFRGRAAINAAFVRQPWRHRMRAIASKAQRHVTPDMAFAPRPATSRESSRLLRQ